MKMIQDIIIKPIITESAVSLIDKKTYTFKVQKKATKPEIAKAVKEMFKVDAAKVNTMIMKRKPKKLGVHSGYRGEWKKAIVTLKPNSKTIEFFEGLS